jgi:hypothetical protein
VPAGLILVRWLTRERECRLAKNWHGSSPRSQLLSASGAGGRRRMTVPLRAAPFNCRTRFINVSISTRGYSVQRNESRKAVPSPADRYSDRHRPYRPLRGTSLVREAALNVLTRLPRTMLAGFGAPTNPSFGGEWVCNESDTPSSAGVLAYDLGSATNRALIAAYPDQRPWPLKVSGQAVLLKPGSPGAVADR